MVRCTLVILLLASIPQVGEPPVLVVKSQAGADVFWEGRSVGKTDPDGIIRLHGIPYGSYELAVEKSGFVRRIVDVHVDAGMQELAVPLEAQPQPAANTPPAVPPTLVQPAAPPQDRGVADLTRGHTPEPAAASGPGAVEVRPGETEPDQAPPTSQVPPPADPEPNPQDLVPATDRTSAQAPPVSVLPELGWWWLLAPAALLAGVAWWRRRRGTSLTLKPAPRQISSDPDLEAFSRTLSPKPRVRPVVGSGASAGDERN